jgi:ABC-type nickel/cobalt efflux system permease component RcnA
VTTDDQHLPVARPRLTAEERRAGFKRLGLVTVGLVGATLVLALVFVLLGATAVAALSAGAGLVGILLVVAGVAAFTRTSPVRRSRGSYSMATTESRREAEMLALGLFGYGITFSALALVLG